MELIMENVRCFAGRHVAPLAPVTLLVGENSSGKSTMLAMARLAWDAMNRWDAVDFNEEPFRLGAFEDIATTMPTAKASVFTIGYRLTPRAGAGGGVSAPFDGDVEARIEFTGRDSQPTLHEWAVEGGAYRIKYASTDREGAPGRVLSITGPGTDLPLHVAARLSVSISDLPREWTTVRGLSSLTQPDLPAIPIATEDLDGLESLVSTTKAALAVSRPYATAPIRSKPTRTYDPLTDRPTPEGDHVPMLLARNLTTRRNEPQARTLLDALTRFGIATGLFDSLDVIRLGGNETNLPFQIRVGKANGPLFNLVDVGYGVSQILPILVEAVIRDDRMLLLQQPEVHLHPKAQAELGSFLGRLGSARRDVPILIETHSDYLLDRIRMDIRDKKGIDAGDVVILYFSRGEQGASITPIRIDDHGNLLNVPPGYREFFLSEERRFLQG